MEPYSAHEVGLNADRLRSAFRERDALCALPNALDARRYALAFLKQLETAPGVVVGTLSGRPVARVAP